MIRPIDEDNAADHGYAMIAKSWGMDGSLRLLWEARAAGLLPSQGLALRTVETGVRGDGNVWGHDHPPNGGTSTLGGDPVTEADYRAYKRRRGPDGDGGMQGVGPLQLCVDPDTPILCADLTWRPAAEVAEGTEIVAFDESGVPTTDGRNRVANPRTSRRRFFRTATVEAMAVYDMERVRVVTDQKQVVVTPNHPLLTWRPERYRWIEAGDLAPGDKIASIPTWESENSYLAGYIAGQYDGDGCLSIGRMKSGVAYSSLLWSQSTGRPLVEHMSARLAELGFEVGSFSGPNKGWGDDDQRGNPMTHLNIKGGWIEHMRMLGMVRPYRLLAHPDLRLLWENRQLNGAGFQVVQAVEPMARGPMVAHQTSTRTLIADGLLSHNTYWSIQDEADAIGGCWVPRCNYRIGFDHFRHLLVLYGERKGAAVYNGGAGSPNYAYADKFDAAKDMWHTRLT